MNNQNIQKLIKEAEVIPKLEYNPDIFKFRTNVMATVRAVKRRLGVLESLLGEIEFEITLNHLDDEEP